jgi:hypothetical protein
MSAAAICENKLPDRHAEVLTETQPDISLAKFPNLSDYL